MSEDQNTPESTETPAAPAAPQVDELKNLKAEFSRKMSNLEQTNAQLLAMLQSQQKPSAPAAEDDLDKVWFENPKLAKEKIKNEVKEEFRRESKAEREVETAYSSTISPLYTQYPELAQEGSELFQKAQEALKSYSKEDLYKNPLLVKAAVLEAATDLGLAPKSKRKAKSEDSDNFTLSTGAGSNKPAPKGKADIDPTTEALARLLRNHINIDDPKVRERIKTNHGRKSYKNWE